MLAYVCLCGDNPSVADRRDRASIATIPIYSFSFPMFIATSVYVSLACFLPDQTRSTSTQAIYL